MASRGEEVLLLAASGLTDKEIADNLSISIRTVEGHWRRLREQTGFSNRAGLVAHHLSAKHESIAAEAELLQSTIETLSRLNETIQEQADSQSAALQNEINLLYTEVNRLKQISQTQQELNAIILKGNVLAFRVIAESPYPCIFMSDSIRNFGYRPTDFTDHHYPITALFHPGDFAKIWTEALAQVETGTHRIERKYRLLTKRGEERVVLDRCVYEESSEGTPATLSIFAFDVTHTEFALSPENHPHLK